MFPRPTAEPTAYTRRLSLLDPGYRREALREIRRIVPTVRGKPYVNLYSGSDEPVTIIPRGAARRSAFGRRLARDFRRATGFALPDPAARPSTAPRERLRWSAWSRFSGERFFAMKEQQARLIKRLDPSALVLGHPVRRVFLLTPFESQQTSVLGDWHPAA